MTYRPGDPWVICDRSGFKVRMSQTRKEWTGLRVRKEDWEPRHPQDYVRAVKDDQRVHDARPESADVFLAANEVALGEAILAWNDENGSQQYIQWDDEDGLPKYIEWDSN